MSRPAIKQSRDVLFLGKSGVGKTTTINTLANIVAYDTLDNAVEANEPIVLVPFQYDLTHSDNTTETIKMGGFNVADRDNEQVADPELSCTQSPRIYSFVKDDKAFNFIDMPGFGDTAGAGQDEYHRLQRHEFLRSLTTVHAIVVVIDSNENRITPQFKAALNDVLALVPKAAISNLIFLSSRAYITNFTGQMVEAPLQTYLVEVNKNYIDNYGQKLNLSAKNNVYYVDYISFIHLVNRHKSNKYKNENADVGNAIHAMCWNNTKKSLFDMMARVIGLQGVETRLIGNIDDARSKVLTIIDVMFNITLECDDLKTPKRQEDLKKKLEESGHINPPCTYCNKCRTQSRSGGLFTAAFRICHRNCRCYTSVPPKVFGHRGLERCSNFVNGKCKVCKCAISCHFHDKDTSASLDPDAKVLQFISEFNKKVSQEAVKIRNMAIMAASFLQENTIVQFSKSNITRLQEEINRFENNGSLDLADQRKDLLESYQKSVAEIEHLMKISKLKSVKSEDIDGAFKALFKLPITGRDIENSYNDRTRHDFTFEEPCIYRARYFPRW